MSDITREFIGALGVKMRGGTLRFQAQYLRLLHIPELKTIRRDVLEGLSSAFSARDRKRATYYAKIAYQEAMNNAK